ncbi:MAG: Gfo/Idh/MocA family oxidoreductase [Spirochaetes bacterium]|nr:Gfo/Idh/MocA family oxidoreductase [Spirochaetota bacterium]
MAKRFTIAVVGCGDISRYIALGVKLNPRIRIAACVDSVEETALAFAKRHGIPRHFTETAEMYEGVPGIDAVYLAVPHYLHHGMITDAVRRGIPVFCEKPVCTSLHDAMDICRMAREEGVKVGINYQYRYDSACYAMARAAQRGDLGDITYGRCNLPWYRDDDYFGLGRWRRRIETAGGGTLITQASHILDALLWAVRDKTPVAAQGMTAQRRFRDIEVEDLCMGTLEMDDGSILGISSSMIAVPEQPVSIEVYGSKGTGIYTGPESPRVRFLGAKVKREKTGIFAFHALFRSLEAFRRWILFDEPYLTSVEQSLPVLAAVLAVYASARSGRREPVDTRYRDFLK